MSESSLQSDPPYSDFAQRTYPLGRTFFGVSTVAFGIFQLMRADFVRIVPALPSWIPAHPLWAQASGALLLVIGWLILTGKQARSAAAILAGMILFSVVFLHVPEIAADPQRGFKWTNPCKALALFGGAVFLARPSIRLLEAHPSQIGGTARLRSFVPTAFFGLFLLVCGIQHFVYADFVTQLVPAWLPARPFWTYFTGVALMAGGVGVFIPRIARWAAGLSGLMILFWVFLLHLPLAFADLSKTNEMDGVFEALAVSGVAFLILSEAPLVSSRHPHRKLRSSVRGRLYSESNLADYQNWHRAGILS